MIKGITMRAFYMNIKTPLIQSYKSNFKLNLKIWNNIQNNKLIFNYQYYT